ncbi:conserved exported protein of unknown function (Sialidases 52-296) [Magnetospirillum sp. XM-1]|uniref:sialidase family protein n=1 Tax=Magnetospirillum sp. XM-1 TaxID=1663591 RepID=UPI00073DF14D|nr:sialidase family protein [Magnetospirillum sp. XM-1]CUW41463.1 conserved exported protein of unknown function (Sialidases 52-296) [Magnetospirillum sp. XM-1]
MSLLRPLVLASLLLFAAPSWAAEHQHQHGGGQDAKRSGCAPENTALACAQVASPAFLADGSLALAWAAGGRVMLARSTDLGASFQPAVAVNGGPEAVDVSGDSRPAVAADSKGRVFVAWSVRKDSAYNGTLFLARSTDGGASFMPPRHVASDPSSQRFTVLRTDARDRLYMAWIDKREGTAAKKAGQAYRGAALAVAWSDDGAETFAFEGIAQSNSCECCRIAFDFDKTGRPLVMWRHVFEPNIRDHALMVFADRDKPGSIRKVAEDNWRVDACPHHGPALAAAADGSVHAAWYTAGTARKGVFYARAAGPDAAFSEPRPLGNPATTVSHPQVLALKGRLWMAWKEFDGETTTVQAQVSDDSGRTWSQPKGLARTTDASDRPILLGNGAQAFLSWMTAAEGWRLVAVE